MNGRIDWMRMTVDTLPDYKDFLEKCKEEITQ